MILNKTTIIILSPILSMVSILEEIGLPKLKDHRKLFKLELPIHLSISTLFSMLTSRLIMVIYGLRLWISKNMLENILKPFLFIVRELLNKYMQSIQKSTQLFLNCLV